MGEEETKVITEPIKPMNFQFTDLGQGVVRLTDRQTAAALEKKQQHQADRLKAVSEEIEKTGDSQEWGEAFKRYYQLLIEWTTSRESTGKPPELEELEKRLNEAFGESALWRPLCTAYKSKQEYRAIKEESVKPLNTAGLKNMFADLKKEREERNRE